MGRYEMFRNAVFGGYNKEDVHSYIQSMENELEATRVQWQQEVNALSKELSDKDPEEIAGKIREGFQQEIEDKEDALKKSQDEKEKSQSELKKVREELNRIKVEYQKSQSALKEREKIIADQNNRLQEQENLLKQQKEELERQSDELKEQKKTEEDSQKKPLEQSAENEFDLLDKETIQKVLEDAYENARLIHEEAEKEKERILKEADQEAEEQKKMIVAKVHAELEEKGIQLMAARHKIDKYVTEIKNTQENLYQIYARMKQMVDSMPVRADNYWKEEESWRLVDQMAQEKKKQIENKEK